MQGAVVKIENKARQYIRSYITQQDGAFHFAGLDRNTDYSIVARKDQHRSSRIYLSRFRSRSEPTIVLRLRRLNASAEQPQSRQLRALRP